MARKVVFMGSPAFALPSLRALHAAGHDFEAIYTQPPRPAGRGQKEQKTPVHMLAEELGLGDKVRHPLRLRGDDLAAALALEAEVFCVVAYGLLLPKALVDGKICLNVHPSALPRWRGAAPLQRTVLAGDATTEICVMRLDEGMDTGPVYDRVGLDVGPNMTTGELHDVCAEIGAKRLVEVVAKLEELEAVAQVGEATHAAKITAEMRPLDWRKSALELHNQVRGLSPVPGATAVLAGEVLKIINAEVVDFKCEIGTIAEVGPVGIVVGCGTGGLRIVTLQRPGKGPMAAADVARGWAELAVGKVFTCA